VVEPAKRSLWATCGKIATALVTLLGLLVGAVAAFASTETTDIGKARAFLGSYYGNAPYEPSSTWERLSDSYKANGALAEEERTYADYKKYFTQFETMDVANVAYYDGRSGEWYEADLYVLNKNGDANTTRYAYQLQCPGMSRLPLVDCSPENMEIVNVCVVQPSGRCRQDE
jgi:hypothetical protein